jgi:hypothetical protein
MEDCAVGLDGIQLSAITKAAAISRDVTEVTLGPYSKRANFSYVNNNKEGIYGLDERSFVPVEDEFSIRGKAHNVTSNNINFGIYNQKSFDREDEYSRCIKKLLCEMSQQQQMAAKYLMMKRFLKMEKESQIRRLEMEKEYQVLRRQIEAKILNEEHLIERQLQEDAALASQRQQQLAEEHRQHAQV